jgi:drug/metabolite transporter (DMT)-like permease
VTSSPSSRPLDATAITVTIGLCLSWGFNNVAIKLAIHDIPPLIQSSARSVIAALMVGVWTQARGIPLFKRDGTLRAGILAGVLFALEFLLIYSGLVWTTATRGVLFLYLAPFFVVIGSRCSRRSFSPVAMARPGAVLRRHRHCFRLADAGEHCMAGRRRHHASRRRGRMGSNHAHH